MHMFQVFILKISFFIVRMVYHENLFCAMINPVYCAPPGQYKSNSRFLDTNLLI